MATELKKNTTPVPQPSNSLTAHHKNSSDKIVLIPEKLMTILKSKKDSFNSSEAQRIWYYCDVCCISTESDEFWGRHISRNHSATYPNCFISCNDCGIFMYGLEEKLHSYLKSPSHRAADRIMSKQQDTKQLNLSNNYTGAVWKNIKKYGVVITNTELLIYESIKVAGRQFKFTKTNLHPFESLFMWMGSCFPEVKPMFRCYLCAIPFIKFDIISLWDHLSSNEHIKRANKLSEKKGFLLCPNCQMIFINSFSTLLNHDHVRVMSDANTDLSEVHTDLSEVLGVHSDSMNTVKKKKSEILTNNLVMEKRSLVCANKIHCNSTVTETTLSIHSPENLNVNQEIISSPFLSPLSQNGNSSVENSSISHVKSWSKASSVISQDLSTVIANTVLTDSFVSQGSDVFPMNNTYKISTKDNQKTFVNQSEITVNNCEEYNTLSATNSSADFEEILTVVFNYLLERFSKEAFCRCCPTVYFCSVCSFKCSYFPYWKLHLANPRHKTKVKKSTFITTDKCPNCGLVVLIDKRFVHLLKSPLHTHIDLTLSSFKVVENDFLSNCCVLKKIIKENASFLNDIKHFRSLCKVGCKFEFEKIFVQNFDWFSLKKTVSNCIEQFICFDCKGVHVAKFDSFKEHVINVHKFNSESETWPKSTSLIRVAIFCYGCNNFLVVLTPESLNYFFSYKDENACNHSDAIAEVKKFVLNSSDSFVCDSKINSVASLSEDVNLSPAADKKLKSIFNYLLSRYVSEPFCHDCGTYYYCITCHYGTSYFFYWRKHLASAMHASNMKGLNDSNFHSYHCSLCGLTIYIRKDQIELLNTIEHRNTDDVLKHKLPSETDFLSNCMDVLPKLNYCNDRFLRDIVHCSSCKSDCKFTRLLKASEVCNKQPFILINFNWIDLRKHLKNYLKLNAGILKGKMNFRCLDCEPCYLSMLYNAEDHVINKHGVNSHKCVDSKKCPRTAFFCCVCCTLMVSFCGKFKRNIASIKGTNYCKHEHFLDKMQVALSNVRFTHETVSFLRKLEVHLMSSGFKCSVMKDIVSYACCLCKRNFISLEDLCSHILLSLHTSMYQHMMIIFCYNCNIVNVLCDDEHKLPCICVGCNNILNGIFKLYKDVKLKSKDSRLVKNSYNKLRFFPEVTIMHNFSCEENEYFSCPILTSHYELYSLTVAIPRNCSSIHSSFIYKNIDVSLLAHIQNHEIKGQVSQYHCLVCENIFEDTNSLYLHLKEKQHTCYCYLATQTVQLIPLMIYCEDCHIVLISAELISLERHFQSPNHFANCRKSACRDSLLEDEELWNKSELSEQCLTMFQTKSILNDAIEKLNCEMENASNFYCKIKDKLSHEILLAIGPIYHKACVYYFGSRETGLAKMDSDIDVFIDLDEYYMDECKEVKSATFDLAGLFRKSHKIFEWRRTILHTRVPLVKLWHRSFCINIDLNCLNAAGVENTKLIRFYLEYDERCRWLVMVIKEWGKSNFILGTRNGFNSYMFAWMVFFFLMQDSVGILPTLFFLKSLYKGPTRSISGWDYSFSLEKLTVKAHFKTSNASSWTNFQLLKEFFTFYSKLSSNGIFLCTLTGKILSTSKIESETSVYRNSEGIPVSAADLMLDSPLIIMDPIILNFNITKNIHKSLWIHFKILCLKMLKTCKWLE